MAANRRAPTCWLLPLLAVFTAARAQAVMSDQDRQVATAAELTATAADPAVGNIVVATSLTGLPTLRLSPGKTLRGASSSVTLRFATGQDGLQLSSDNQVEHLELDVDVDRRALFNDTRVE